MVGSKGPAIVKIPVGGVVLDNEKSRYFTQDAEHQRLLDRIVDNTPDGDLFIKASNAYRSTDSRSRPLLRGEYHYGLHNFTGKGTRIDLPAVLNAEPINNVDRVSKIHDLALANARTPQEKMRADKIAISGYKKYKNENGAAAAIVSIGDKLPDAGGMRANDGEKSHATASMGTRITNSSKLKHFIDALHSGHIIGSRAHEVISDIHQNLSKFNHRRPSRNRDTRADVGDILHMSLKKVRTGKRLGKAVHSASVGAVLNLLRSGGDDEDDEGGTHQAGFGTDLLNVSKAILPWAPLLMSNGGETNQPTTPTHQQPYPQAGVGDDILKGVKAFTPLAIPFVSAASKAFFAKASGGDVDDYVGEEDGDEMGQAGFGDFVKKLAKKTSAVGRGLYKFTKKHIVPGGKKAIRYSRKHILPAILAEAKAQGWSKHLAERAVKGVKDSGAVERNIRKVTDKHPLAKELVDYGRKRKYVSRALGRVNAPGVDYLAKHAGEELNLASGGNVPRISHYLAMAPGGQAFVGYASGGSPLSENETQQLVGYATGGGVTPPQSHIVGFASGGEIIHFDSQGNVIPTEGLSTSTHTGGFDRGGEVVNSLTSRPPAVPRGVGAQNVSSSTSSRTQQLLGQQGHGIYKGGRSAKRMRQSASGSMTRFA